jgi:hypothetical protein
MPLVDVALCELPVHVPGGLLIGEAVTQAVGHMVYAAAGHGAMAPAATLGEHSVSAKAGPGDRNRLVESRVEPLVQTG